jgi:hypothetical protein
MQSQIEFKIPEGMGSKEGENALSVLMSFGKPHIDHVRGRVSLAVENGNSPEDVVRAVEELGLELAN